MDPQTLGLVLIAIAVGALIVRIAVQGRAQQVALSRVSTLVIVAMLVGLVVLLARSVLSGYLGGIGG